MTEMAYKEHTEGFHEIVSDFEKSAMLFSKLYTECKLIREKLTQDQLEFDMYADDPAGVTGIIGSAVGQLGGNLARQYNGPYIIRDIVATWATSLEAPLASQSASQTAFGNPTAPGALTNLAQVTVPATGQYTVLVQFNFVGTPAATDTSNLQIVVSAPSNTIHLVNSDASESLMTLGPLIVTANAGATITVQNIGAGTAGVVYQTNLIVTPVGPVLPSPTPNKVTLQFADRTFQLVPESGLFQVTDISIKMQRDDLILMTVVPAAPCHLEIMGYAEKRRTDHA